LKVMEERFGPAPEDTVFVSAGKRWGLSRLMDVFAAKILEGSGADVFGAKNDAL
jgi:hypothetical protein